MSTSLYLMDHNTGDSKTLHRCITNFRIGLTHMTCHFMVNLGFISFILSVITDNIILFLEVLSVVMVYTNGYYMAYKPITFLCISFLFIEMKFIHFHSFVMFTIKFMNICND